MVGRPRLAVAALALVLAGALLVSCSSRNESSGPPATPVAPTNGELDVRAKEWGFEPSSIVLTEGEPVNIVLQNDGAILHDIKIRDMPADSVSSHGSGPLTAEEGEPFVSADAGDSGTLALVPSQPGTYKFYCTVAGHDGLGMHGTIIVVPAP